MKEETKVRVLGDVLGAALLLGVALLVNWCAGARAQEKSPQIPQIAQRAENAGPEIARLARHGCVIDRVVVFKGDSPARAPGNVQWKLVVWADYRKESTDSADSTEKGKGKKEGHDWELTYSYREERAKAMKDCDEWMRGVEKEQKRVHR